MQNFFEQGDKIVALIKKAARIEATPEELQELQQWADADPKNKAMLADFTNTDWVLKELRIYEDADIEKPLANIWAKINAQDKQQ